MRFSFWLAPYGRWGNLDNMCRAAVRAEELGFSSVSISDHIVCPTGEHREGVTPVWHDFFVLTTHIANATRHIRLVGSLVLPYRRLLPMAKQISSVDVVSDGRFTLVACVGWLKQEFDMLGVPYTERGAITDEYLRAMKILWTQDAPYFDGKYSRFSDIIFEPKCVQHPHVPIWIGGDGPRAIQRVVDHADGWMPMGGDLSPRLGETVETIKERAYASGRNPSSFEFRYTLGIGQPDPVLQAVSRSIQVAEPAVARMSDRHSAEGVAESIDGFKRAGFTELCLSFAWQTPSDFLERIEWFASDVMPLVS